MGDSGSAFDRDETYAAAARRETSSPEPGFDPEGSARSLWRARLFVALTVGLLWLVLSWSLTFHHTLLLVLWPVSTLFVVWLCDRLGVVTVETMPLELTFSTLAYVPWLAVQVVISSLGVLRSAWWPGARIEPSIARIESRTRTDLGLVSFANSITLTPGTLSLEARSPDALEQVDGGPWILVHALVPGGLDELRSGEMGRRLARVEAPLCKHLDAERRRAEEEGA